MMRIASVGAIIAVAHGCSNFYMNYTNPLFKLSARTLDLPVEMDVVVHTFPAGQTANIQGLQWKSKYGYVGWFLQSKDAVKQTFSAGIDFGSLDVVAEGMNTEGLSCALQLFAGAKMQAPHRDPGRNLFSLSLCKWVLENFARVEEVMQSLPAMRVVHDSPTHFVINDANGKIIVVEFIDGYQRIHVDKNDGVDTFGILTNQPDFDWQLENVKRMEWERSLAREAVSVPGGWYPDDRFIRIRLIKEGIERTKQPKSYQEAVANLVAVVNSVTVPMGDLPGTGGAVTAGAMASHTLGSLIRDHRNLIYYVRSELNPSLRRISLKHVGLAKGDKVMWMDIVEEDTQFFINAEKKFHPVPSMLTV